MKLGYARVSSTDQDLGRQLDALKAAGCEKIYPEKLSGASYHNRPELKQLLADITVGDILVVQKIDRLGRSLIDLVNILDGLRKINVGFISLGESIDTTTNHGQLIFQIIAAFAEYERKIITERVRDGLARKKRNGEHIGRKTKITGDQEILFREYVNQGLSTHELGVKFHLNHKVIYRHLHRLGVWDIYQQKQNEKLQQS